MSDLKLALAPRTLDDQLRAIHRWSATIFAVFMLLIALTGTSLQIIASINGPEPPRIPGAPPPPHATGPIETLRTTLLDIHTGFFAGYSGAIYSLLCGLCLLFFTLSGLWMFFSMYLSRARLGRTNLFWSAGSAAPAVARMLHRAVTLCLGVVLLAISFAAVMLDFDFLRTGRIPGHDPNPGGPPPGAGPGMQGGPPPPGGLHDTMLSLHTLRILGPAGAPVGIVAGLGLLAFAISGIVMYLDLHSRRRHRGHAAVFW